MKNEAKLEELWTELNRRGADSLRPNFAQRVMAKAASMRDDFRPRTAFAIGFGTALACLALTLAINLWNANRASDSAMAQWASFNLDDTSPDQET